MQYQTGSPHMVAIYQVQNLIPNSNYPPETMMWTDRQADSYIPPPPKKKQLRLWGYN
jgi:hypothetical protein